MTKVNALSDFAVRLRLWAPSVDEPDVVSELGWPECKMTATLTIGNPDTSSRKFVATYDPAGAMPQGEGGIATAGLLDDEDEGGETPETPTDPAEGEGEEGEAVPALVNLGKDDTGRMVIYADNHNLGRGTLYLTLKFEVEDESYADGIRQLVNMSAANIELVNMKSEDKFGPIDIRVDLPDAFNAVTAERLETIGEAASQPLAEALAALGNEYNAGVQAIRHALKVKGVETSETDSLVTLALKIESI